MATYMDCKCDLFQRSFGACNCNCENEAKTRYMLAKQRNALRESYNEQLREMSVKMLKNEVERRVKEGQTVIEALRSVGIDVNDDIIKAAQKAQMDRRRKETGRVRRNGRRGQSDSKGEKEEYLVLVGNGLMILGLLGGAYLEWKCKIFGIGLVFSKLQEIANCLLSTFACGGNNSLDSCEDVKQQEESCENENEMYTFVCTPKVEDECLDFETPKRKFECKMPGIPLDSE